MVAHRKLGSGCPCVAVGIGGGGDGIASTPIAVLVAAADPGPASTGTSATNRNRMPRLRQSKRPARACGASLQHTTATRKIGREAGVGSVCESVLHTGCAET